MQARIQDELKLLRSRIPGLEFKEDGQWVRIPSYKVPDGWDRASTEVALQILVAYPGSPPYGIYVPIGMRFQGELPTNNYTEPAQTQPPFPGTWGIFSWTPVDGQWKPTADVVTGSNLLNFVMSFEDRFMEGR